MKNIYATVGSYNTYRHVHNSFQLPNATPKGNFHIRLLHCKNLFVPSMNAVTVLVRGFMSVTGGIARKGNGIDVFRALMLATQSCSWFDETPATSGVPIIAWRHERVVLYSLRFDDRNPANRRCSCNSILLIHARVHLICLAKTRGGITMFLERQIRKPFISEQ